MWKFEGDQLKNKAEDVQTGWKEIVGEDKEIFIETDIPNLRTEIVPKQLWVKGELTQDSFFTLKNVGTEKFLTCGSSDANFEVAGKIMYSIYYNNFNRPL